MGLPEGWVETRLLDVVAVATGKVDANHARDSGKYTFFTCALKPMKAETYSFDGELIILPGNGANVGHVAYYNGKIEAYQRTYILFEIEVYPKYLYWQLKKAWKATNLDKQFGSATNYLKIGNFKGYFLPIPPLNEQIRIVNKLDSLLAKVEIAQNRLEKIPVLLKRFRQSVLAAATSGELTRDWRAEHSIIDPWKEKPLNNLLAKAFDGPFGSKLKTVDYTDNGVKVARLENIGHLHFFAEKETFIGFGKYEELKKNTLEHRDVLFSSFVDENTRVCVFDEKHGTYINKADCFCFRADKSKIIPEFLAFVFASQATYKMIKKQVHGVTRPRVNISFMKSLAFKMPGLEEQAEIVRRVESLFAQADKVEAQYKAAKTRLDKLTQSILAKAFRGELVPQDPNDEPASELLKRIQAEREQQPKTKPKRTRKVA